MANMHWEHAGDTVGAWKWAMGLYKMDVESTLYMAIIHWEYACNTVGAWSLALRL